MGFPGFIIAIFVVFGILFCSILTFMIVMQCRACGNCQKRNHVDFDSVEDDPRNYPGALNNTYPPQYGAPNQVNNGYYPNQPIYAAPSPVNNAYYPNQPQPMPQNSINNPYAKQNIQDKSLSNEVSPYDIKD